MKSYWENSTKNKREFEKLKQNVEADICIIGGGLAGISTAYYLTKTSKKVVVLEKDEVCGHTSGHSTGKITSQHGLFYNYLINSQGKEYAKKYLEANEEAIKNIKQIIEKEDIDCDFKEESAYVFTRKNEDVQKILTEVEAVNKIGKKAKFKNNIELPIGNIKGAIEFENQAQFNPVKYVYGLCDKIIENNGKIYEHTKVIDNEQIDDGYIVHTEDYYVKTRCLVMTTRYPIKIFPGYYFIKMYQSSSYAIVVDTGTDLPDGMYISSETPTISFRTIYEKDKKLLLAVGYDYKTGKQDIDGYKKLEKLIKSMYPNAKVINKWIAEDCISLDKIPYIGEFSNMLPNMYVATGFNKWGISSSNIAANIISDKILGQKNPYKDLFKATRVRPIKNIEEVKNMLKESMESIIIKKFKEPNNPICTHLGCELSYNEIEGTWDCPCHGSRFTKEGKSIESPSVKNIETEQNEKDI